MCRFRNPKTWKVLKTHFKAFYLHTDKIVSTNQILVFVDEGNI